MKTFIASALALSALTSVALAGESVVLTDAQMDAVTAGQITVDQRNMSTITSNVAGGSSGEISVTQSNTSTVESNVAGAAPGGNGGTDG